MPKATGKILGSGFQTKPSISMVLIFLNSSFKSVSCSQTFTSKTTIDLAAGFYFFLVSFLGLATGAGAGVSSSSKRLSSSAFFSSFLSSFLSSFFATFFPPLKASWHSLGRSLGPTSAFPVAMAVYQLTVLVYFFLCPSPNITPKTTETELARERSAMVRVSATRNFFSARCFSTMPKNLLTSSISLGKSILSPLTCFMIDLAAGSNSQEVKSSH